MFIEEYGTWVGLRENGDVRSKPIKGNLIDAIKYIRDHLPKGSVHWITIIDNGKNSRFEDRLGFQFKEDIEGMLIVCTGKGAICDNNGIPIRFGLNKKKIKSVLYKNMHRKSYSCIRPFLK